MLSSPSDGVLGDLLDEHGGGEDLERGADEVLGGLGVAEADHEALEAGLACDWSVCIILDCDWSVILTLGVAQERDALDQSELVEEAPQHHLLLPHVGEVAALKQDLMRDWSLKC